MARRNATTRAQLVDHALRIAQGDGLDAVTVRRLADEAGVAVGTLYGYFPTKQALVRSVAAGLEDRFVAALEQACPATGPLRPTVPAIADAVTRIGFASAPLPALLALPPEDGSTGSRVTAWIVERLAGARRRGEIASDDHDLRAAAAFGLVRAALEHGVAGGSAEATAAVIAAGLAGLVSEPDPAG